MTGTFSHEAISQLIGAWAVDACSPEEADLVQAHLRRCDICTTEARVLRETVADLGGDDLRPPPGLGARLRTAAHVRRRPAPRAPAYAKPYAAQVAALDLTLSTLDPGGWQRIAAYEEMSVHDLLAHLLATDSLVAAALGVPVQPPMEPGTNPVARTAVVVAQERERPVEQTLRAWRDQAEALCRVLPRRPGDATVTLGFPMVVPDVLLARAFETWIHTEDIAGATASPAATPLPENLSPMADLAARMLPKVTARGFPDGGLIGLHLTGPGGGDWTIPAGRSDDLGGVPDAEITADVVEFCRLVGGRRDPATFPAVISGDTAVARRWLAAAPKLAPYP
ncbi:maleylpyruvate isomerase family mycothiol-dependent enzyme [Actinoplanes sp. NPDC024001]|uniref:maleylpyruvate isomerase family mycothiol-dependent enzyme n=1 Tax=Actinoplanes sp. NPDC024001 TaxID=3154598 RepID=UPI0033E139E8